MILAVAVIIILWALRKSTAAAEQASRKAAMSAGPGMPCVTTCGRLARHGCYRMCYLCIHQYHYYYYHYYYHHHYFYY